MYQITLHEKFDETKYGQPEKGYNVFDNTEKRIGSRHYYLLVCFYKNIIHRERSKIKTRLNLEHCPKRGGGSLTNHQCVPTLI